MRYFLAVFCALVLALPAGSNTLATKHYFTVVNNTELHADCPDTAALQVKCSTETTWHSPPWYVHQCEDGAKLDYREPSWGVFKHQMDWQCENPPADLIPERWAGAAVRRTQVVRISGTISSWGCGRVNVQSQASCAFHCAILAEWRDCDYEKPVRPGSHRTD